MATADQSELNHLIELSARLGRNPMLVQAATGNTSIKTGGALWIKASGHWLSQAQSTEIFLPADREEILSKVAAGVDPGSAQVMASGQMLRTSVETAMHAVLPWAVVLHVHSIHTIAWAVRCDARERLAERLRGLPWSWVPYSLSGIPLAREVEFSIADNPESAIFVLGNHGLVVCGRNCEEAEALLDEVERRLAVMPRKLLSAEAADAERLENLASPGWRLPSDSSVHVLATDSSAMSILAGGTLYPCQAIFLGPDGEGPWKLVPGAGVLVRDSITQVAQDTLTGLAAVVSRIEDGAPIRYLDEAEMAELLCQNVYQYRDLVETNHARVGALL